MLFELLPPLDAHNPGLYVFREDVYTAGRRTTYFGSRETHLENRGD